MSSQRTAPASTSKRVADHRPTPMKGKEEETDFAETDYQRFLGDMDRFDALLGEISATKRQTDDVYFLQYRMTQLIQAQPKLNDAVTIAPLGEFIAWETEQRRALGNIKDRVREIYGKKLESLEKRDKEAGHIRDIDEKLASQEEGVLGHILRAIEFRRMLRTLFDAALRPGDTMRRFVEAVNQKMHENMRLTVPGCLRVFAVQGDRLELLVQRSLATGGDMDMRFPMTRECGLCFADPFGMVFEIQLCVTLGGRNPSTLNMARRSRELEGLRGILSELVVSGEHADVRGAAENFQVLASLAEGQDWTATTFAEYKAQCQHLSHELQNYQLSKQAAIHNPGLFYELFRGYTYLAHDEIDQDKRAHDVKRAQHHHDAAERSAEIAALIRSEFAAPYEHELRNLLLVRPQARDIRAVDALRRQ